MSLKIFKNYLFNIVIVFTNIIFPMLLFPYASRILTPQNFGKYSFANSISSYFIVIATLGISSYGVREISNLKLKGADELKKGITELLLLTLISSVLAFIVFILSIYNLETFKIEKKLFLIFSLQILFSFLTLDYFFIAMEEHKRRTIRVLIIKGLSLIFLFTFVKKTEDYNTFAAVIILPEIIAKFIDFLTIRKYFSLKGKLNVLKHLKAMLVIFIYLFSTTIYLNLDTTMLGILKTNIEVGYYAVAIKMTKIIIPLITSLGVVLTPGIIKSISEKNQKKLFENIDYYIDFIIAFTLPMIIILNFISKNLIYLFSGSDYLVAVLPMKIMLPIILFISLSGLCAAQILIPSGKENKILNISMVGLVLNISLNFLLIPKYSIVGAATATLISEFLVCILRINEVKKELKEYKVIKKYRYSYIYASLIIILIGVKLNRLILGLNEFIQIIILGTILTLVYINILILLEDKYVKKLLKKVQKRRNYR
ncbi:MAG: flippase [Bacilli bacterium]